jgi:hypothetical protein
MKRTFEIEWNDDLGPMWMNADNLMACLVAYCPNTKLGTTDVTDKPLASEALYGFMGWLTSRKERVTLSHTDECGHIADLINQFCNAQGLREPRDDWGGFQVQMKEIPIYDEYEGATVGGR